MHAEGSAVSTRPHTIYDQMKGAMGGVLALARPVALVGQRDGLEDQRNCVACMEY